VPPTRGSKGRRPLMYYDFRWTGVCVRSGGAASLVHFLTCHPSIVASLGGATQLDGSRQ
jgi:hypothetical protein